MFSLLFVVRWVEGVEILAVKIVLRYPHRITEALEMHYLALAQVAQRVDNVGVVGQANEVFVRRARLLLRSLILGKVGQGVALDADVLHIKRHARRSNGIVARGVVDEVVGVGRGEYLLGREVARELIEYRAHYLKVRKLLRT